MQAISELLMACILYKFFILISSTIKININSIFFRYCYLYVLILNLRYH